MRKLFAAIIVIIIVIIIGALYYLPATAQTKKKSATRTASRTQAKAQSAPASEPEKLGNASDAGKYAKSMANKMYNTDPVYGDKHHGLNVNIIDWKALKSDDGLLYYFIKVDLAWQEGTGGIGDWKNVRYSGVALADQYGCNALYLINKKVEPAILGLLKRALKIPEDKRDVLASKDDWTTNIQYYWAPDGCLE